MPIFHRQLLKELSLNALITFTVITGIFLLAGSLQVLHKSEFLTFAVFGRLVYFFVGTNLDKILPMTVLVATVVTFGRWAADNELNAIRHCGISLYNVFAPGILFGLAGTGIVLFVNDAIAPRMELNQRAMMASSLADTIENVLESGGDRIQVGNMTLFFDTVDPETKRVQRLRLKVTEGDRDEDATSRIKYELKADSGIISVDRTAGKLNLSLQNVLSLAGNAEGIVSGAVKYAYTLPDEAINKRPRHQTLSELVAAERRPNYEKDPKQKELRGEYHRRISGSFACVLFVLLAMPLAVIFRHGNRMVAFLIAFLIAMALYYPTFILGELLTKETDLNPIIAMWTGSVVLFLLGGSLTFVVLRR